jgi:Flp pilus assembly protein TadB
MVSAADARREVALEIEKLAHDFERGDEAAFRRGRTACWAVTVLVTLVMLMVLILGGDWRYLGSFWALIVGLTWIGYALSTGRQRRQTNRLKALAAGWLNGEPPAAA